MADMRKLRPVLFQGVLVASAWRSRPLQLLLEKDFLEDIASRFFIHGERSLDLPQGLMVYLAWYQYSAEQASQLAYRFTSIAVTLLIDLGLHRRPRGPTNHERNVASLASETQAKPTAFPKFWSLDARYA
ncbi:hypothetical protein DL98DRAFT_597363 [Cadophora sp. DSE1049]|nr:hypothetical protein DL98DRAFT_597363 [Cadophora sp. DSE1049]